MSVMPRRMPRRRASACAARSVPRAPKDQVPWPITGSVSPLVPSGTRRTAPPPRRAAIRGPAPGSRRGGNLGCGQKLPAAGRTGARFAVPAPAVRGGRGEGVRGLAEDLAGFEEIEVRELPEVRGTAHRLEHRRSGARWIHVHTPGDGENLFSITVPTPPRDSSGAPHILEHSVLAGSQTYPVRDPFFQMLDMSLGTYINAFTGSDYTCYPVASTVPQDLWNLAAVYFDAVFHPLLSEETFRREGHRLTPVDPARPEGALTRTGIVFNEMKGYYSQPERRLWTLSNEALLPDTIYARDAGGDPAAIPDLTHEGLVGFHRAHYHPARCYFFTYGDIPLAAHAAFLGPRLDGFTRPASPPQEAGPIRQPRWGAPRRASYRYQVGEGEGTAEKTYLLVEWLCADACDPADSVAFQVLSRVLLGNEAAPLRRAVVDSRLGKALSHSGYGEEGPEGYFSVGLKGSEPDRAEAFEALVLRTLRDLVAGGLEPAEVEAAFHQAAYGIREISTGMPLRVRAQVVEGWRLAGDPYAFVRLGEHLDACHERWRRDPDLFTRLIRERLLENPHRLLLVLEPSRDYQAELDAAFAARMARERAAMTDEEARAAAADSAEVERRAALPESPQAIALLPQLRLADVPRRPRHIPTAVESVGERAVLLRNDVFANGIDYLTLDLDLSGLPEDEWDHLPRLTDAVHKMGAAGRGYEEMARRVAACTGGVGCWASAAPAISGGRTLRGLRFSLRALDGQVEAALGVLHDLVFAVDPRDRARLEVVLEQALAGARSGLLNGGVGTAMRQAGRWRSAEGRLQERLGGASQFRLLERLQREDPEALMARIEALRDASLGAARVVASFTGSDAAYETVRRALGEWSARLRPAAPAAPLRAPEPGVHREGLAAPLQVAYVAVLQPGPGYLDPDSPLLSVGAHLLTGVYVRPEIRFRGAAYGGACTYDPVAGQVGFLSWQDPQIVRTLGVFARAREHVAAAGWTQADVDRAVISTLKDGERPIRPAEATGTALQRYLSGLTPEMRDARHEAILGATVAGVRRALLAALEAGPAAASTCVFASRAKIEDANRELGPEGALATVDLFPAG
jgi:Zn-dependent M16 (insulinase) family peptidase